MQYRAPTLEGSVVRLEPLGHHHVDDLLVAAADRTTFGHTMVPRSAAAMTVYVTQLLADADAGRALPFAQVLRATGRAVGCTRFMEIVRVDDRVTEIEIGGTWLATEVQRTAVNSEAKLLLLTHAFDVLGVVRVAICTDARNARSRAAIERLGATFEGVLRHHRRAFGDLVEEGTPRDTAVYSVLPDEWPAVRGRLHTGLLRLDDGTDAEPRPAHD